MKERSIIIIALVIALMLWGYSWLLAKDEQELTSRQIGNTGLDSAPSRDTNSYPQRIISLAPSITEILFALGAGNRVVGVTQFCNYPPEAAELPKVAGFSSGLNVEAIINLKPDLIIATKDGNNPEDVKQLIKQGLNVKVIEHIKFEGIAGLIADIGKLIGIKQVSAEFTRKVDRVKALAAALPDKPTTLMVVDREGLFCAGLNTFPGDMVGIAGGSLFSDGAESYPKLTLETIIKAAPEVIIESTMASGNIAGQQKQSREFWSRWPDIPAVKNKRIYFINGDLINRNGPRAADGLVEIFKALHPGKWKD